MGNESASVFAFNGHRGGPALGRRDLDREAK